VAMAGNQMNLCLGVIQFQADLDSAKVFRMSTQFRVLLAVATEHHNLLTQRLLPLVAAQL